MTLETEESVGRVMRNVMGCVAEVEEDLRRERRREGSGTAKAEGRDLGSPASIDAAEVQRLLKSGIGATRVAKELGIGRATVYRLSRSGGPEQSAPP